MGMIESVFFPVMVNKRSVWVFRKHAGFPQRGNPARIQASLSSPYLRDCFVASLLATPAQPCSRFSQTASLITVDVLGMIEKKGDRLLFLRKLFASRNCAFSSRKREKAACPLFIKR